MGGMGSGLPLGTTTKATTEAAHRIDLAYMKRAGLLAPGASGTLSWRRGERRTGSISYTVADTCLRLSYTCDGEPMDYPVRLSRTPCHFGGSRVWLHCPNAGCGRRVRVLYGGQHFVCRSCARLVYASTREDAADLHARRAERIHQRLGHTGKAHAWAGVFDTSLGPRPKGMHRRTYIELCTRYDYHRLAFLRAVDARFGFGVFEAAPGGRGGQRAS